MSCLYIRNGELDMKWRSRQTKSRKEDSWIPCEQVSKQPLDRFSSNMVVKQNGGVLELLSRFHQGVENRGFNQIQKFFHPIASNNKGFVLAKKNWGVRCTLSLPTGVLSLPLATLFFILFCATFLPSAPTD